MSWGGGDCWVTGGTGFQWKDAFPQPRPLRCRHQCFHSHSVTVCTQPHPPTVLCVLSFYQVFERRWFARRRCLDVGCNEGLLTLALAARFGPRSMLGVDIDSGLIGKACRFAKPYSLGECVCRAVHRLVSSTGCLCFLGQRHITFTTRQRVTPVGAPVPAGVGPCAWRHSSGRPCGAAPGYRAAARLPRAAAFRSCGHLLSSLTTTPSFLAFVCRVAAPRCAHHASLRPPSSNCPLTCCPACCSAQAPV